MTLRFLLLMTALLLGACTDDGPMPRSGATAEEEAAPPTNRIDIPSTVRSNIGITFAGVERRRVDGTIRVPGAFELRPLARHEYRMTLSGHVDLAVDQYQRVEPGDLLYRFRSPEWPELQHEIIVGEQNIASASAAIEVAHTRIDEVVRRLAIMHERLSSLNEAEIRNADLEAQAAELEATLPRLRAELDQAKTGLANARRTRRHALHVASIATGIPESRLDRDVDHGGESHRLYHDIDWIEVRAAEPGIVELLTVTDGAFAEAPSLVLSTVDPSKVRFRAMALQADLARFGDMSEATIVPPNAPGIALNDGVSASVSVGLEAHPQQRTVTLVAIPEEGRAWIRPGVSAFLEVVVETTGGPALAIPRSAVVKDGITHVFFRRDPADPNKAIRVEADMGIDDGRWVVINSGITLNDEIVLDGAYELKLASQQSGALQKGGHFHADGTFHADDH